MKMFNNTARRVLLCACVAGLIAAVIGGVSMARAGGTNHHRTFTLREVSTGGKFISITHSKNGAPGDMFIFSANLKRHGTRVGDLNAKCTLMLHNHLVCDGVFRLPGGTLTGEAFQANSNSNGTTRIAITGGTGAYRGASGEVVSIPVNNNINRDIFHLD
jgi:hypothetical protein